MFRQEHPARLGGVTDDVVMVDLHLISGRSPSITIRPRRCSDSMTVVDQPGALGDLSPDQAKELCVRSMQLMANGTRAQFDELIHPDAVNREAKDEPPESRGRGPTAFYATALWLREWFDDLAFDVHDVVVEGDIVVIHNTMSGRQTGTATIYGEDGSVLQALPATGKRFATTQTHWFRLRDGLLVEHWANRDDQGTAMQLGWVPPTPWFLLRMFLATRRARRREATRPRYE
jgi:predicted ester cyclase